MIFLFFRYLRWQQCLYVAIVAVGPNFTLDAIFPRCAAAVGRSTKKHAPATESQCHPVVYHDGLCLFGYATVWTLVAETVCH